MLTGPLPLHAIAGAGFGHALALTPAFACAHSQRRPYKVLSGITHHFGPGPRVAGIAKREVFPPTATRSPLPHAAGKRRAGERAGACGSLACEHPPLRLPVCARSARVVSHRTDKARPCTYAQVQTLRPLSLRSTCLSPGPGASVAAPLSAAQAAATGPRSRSVARVGFVSEVKLRGVPSLFIDIRSRTAQRTNPQQTP